MVDFIDAGPVGFKPTICSLGGPRKTDLEIEAPQIPKGALHTPTFNSLYSRSMIYPAILEPCIEIIVGFTCYEHRSDNRQIHPQKKIP